MFPRNVYRLLYILCAVLWFVSPLLCQWTIDVESGLASARYNDVQIPKETGTLFSLTEDLTAETTTFYRIRIGYRFGKRHSIYIFGAPFTLKAEGRLPSDTLFNEKLFPAGVPLNASYTFNSYRLTYRYDLIANQRWNLGIGVTAKIRDAAISLSGGGIESEKTNVGFVPLLNFYVQLNLSEQWSFVLDGDALASPGGQGRAEDVFLGVQYRISDKMRIKAGYRLLEGGADVSEVYNFAWVNYLVIGLSLHF